MWRGAESTGIALVEHGKERTLPEVYKDSLCAFDFCKRPWFERALGHMDDYSIAIGHTRSATRGLTLSARNAHPFQHGHITLTHNGTIDNSWDLIPHADRPNDVNVDSDIVALSMGRLNEKEDEKVVLEKLRGAYTLVWHNTRDGSLNVARNDKKPLFFCYLKKENSMFWASEYTLLCHLLERRGLDIDGKVKWPEPMSWYKFHTKDLRRWSAVPFVSRPPFQDLNQWRQRSGEDMRTQMRNGRASEEYPDPTPAELAEIREQVKGGSVDTDDVKAIQDWLQARRGSTDLKHSGMPSTLKKVQQAARALKELGFTFNHTTRMVPTQWTPYKKNREKLGLLTGVSSNGQYMVMHNVLRTSWDKYKIFRKVFVSCINVRRMDNNRLAVVCIEHPKHEEKMEQFFRDQADAGREESRHASTALIYNGPANQKVSAERYLELTKGGCGNCAERIELKDSDYIYWHGEPPQPICPTCTADAAFWTYIDGNPNSDLHQRLTH